MMLIGPCNKDIEAWIMDFGATDHMTSSLQKQINNNNTNTAVIAAKLAII